MASTGSPGSHSVCLCVCVCVCLSVIFVHYPLCRSGRYFVLFLLGAWLGLDNGLGLVNMGRDKLSFVDFSYLTLKFSFLNFFEINSIYTRSMVWAEHLWRLGVESQAEARHCLTATASPGLCLLLDPTLANVCPSSVLSPITATHLVTSKQ